MIAHVARKLRAEVERLQLELSEARATIAALTAAHVEESERLREAIVAARLDGRLNAGNAEAERDEARAELERLRAFAEVVRDDFRCTLEGEPLSPPEDHVDHCLHCYALQALGDAQ